MSHFIDKCKHGRVVSQCRCMGPKTERVVPCRDTACLTEPETYQGKHQAK